MWDTPSFCILVASTPSIPFLDEQSIKDDGSGRGRSRAPRLVAALLLAGCGFRVTCRARVRPKVTEQSPTLLHLNTTAVRAGVSSDAQAPSRSLHAGRTVGARALVPGGAGRERQGCSQRMVTPRGCAVTETWPHGSFLTESPQHTVIKAALGTCLPVVTAGPLGSDALEQVGTPDRPSRVQTCAVRASGSSSVEWDQDGTVSWC